MTERTSAARDLRGVENDLVASLFAYTLPNCPGVSIAIEAEKPLLSLVIF